MGREFEYKYRASASQLEAIRRAFGGFAAIEMETVYYDTPDKALRGRHWTLRRRLENGRPVCTVKTPNIDGSRGEWEVVCASIEEAVSALCKLGAPQQLLQLCAGGLTPYCGARFTRQAAALEIPGCTVELALDQGCFLGGGREQPFAEAEVELKAGSELAMVAFAENLAREFGLTREKASKVRRAMALADAQPPDTERERDHGRI